MSMLQKCGRGVQILWLYCRRRRKKNKKIIINTLKKPGAMEVSTAAKPAKETEGRAATTRTSLEPLLTLHSLHLAPRSPDLLPCLAAMLAGSQFCSRA